MPASANVRACWSGSTPPATFRTQSFTCQSSQCFRVTSPYQLRRELLLIRPPPVHLSHELPSQASDGNALGKESLRIDEDHDNRNLDQQGYGHHLRDETEIPA